MIEYDPSNPKHVWDMLNRPYKTNPKDWQITPESFAKLKKECRKALPWWERGALRAIDWLESQTTVAELIFYGLIALLGLVCTGGVVVGVVALVRIMF